MASLLTYILVKSMADGKAECMAQIVQKMKVMGFSDEQIQTVTGFPTETIVKSEIFS